MGSPTRRAAIALLAILTFIALLFGVTAATDDTSPSPAKCELVPGQLHCSVPAAQPAPDQQTNGYADRLEQRHVAEEHAHDARTMDVPGLSDRAEDRAARANDRLADAYDTSGILLGAAPQPSRGRCPERGPNHSSRNGAQLLLGVVHVTVSPNHPGLRDGLGVCDFLSRATTKASTTWIVDNEGNSWAQIPVPLKAWTQAFFNPWAVAIEFIGWPEAKRAQWTDAQYREGARLLAREFRRHGIPMQRGRVDATNCKVLRAGVVTHNELGRCGGGHWDPGPAFDMARFMQLLRRYGDVAAQEARRLDRGRVACRKLNWHRARAADAGHWSRARGHRARELKATIARAGVDCPPKR